MQQQSLKLTPLYWWGKYLYAYPLVTPSHPSVTVVDEAWHWPQHSLRSGWLKCITSSPTYFIRQMWFVDCWCVHDYVPIYVAHYWICMRRKQTCVLYVILKCILLNLLPLFASLHFSFSPLSLPPSYVPSLSPFLLPSFSFLPPPQAGVTALMKASQAGHLDVVRSLLTKEAGIDLKCRVSVIIDEFHCNIHLYSFVSQWIHSSIFLHK